MSPSKARHYARHICWFKQRYQIGQACMKLANRLQAGDPQGSVYRCPFSHPDEEPHFHLSTGEHKPPSPNTVAEVLDTLGDDAWRTNDSEVRADAD